MLHLEGGWPKEINVKDDEAVLRFRRRVVKDEYWAPKMKSLIDPMECCVLQNNAINIYENYFDDMEPTPLVLPRSIRTSNMYVDPQPIVRPINHLSWSPGAQNRLAAAYSFMEFEMKSSNVNSSSYIWDIGMFLFYYRATTRILSTNENIIKENTKLSRYFKMDLPENLVYFFYK
ncbi:dynein intermediate chain 3, ciliary-like [Temnothorax nylanderi]|uniref:dynein intermediate chain 3, ciliary-like n=1 Tax=Temnothorax nylanderi TaxID=102681 RepID=UPI003A83BEC0